MAAQPLPTLPQQPTQATTILGPVAGTRELCRSVSEEVDSGRMNHLDELYRALDERELLASLL